MYFIMLRALLMINPAPLIYKVHHHLTYHHFLASSFHIQNRCQTSPIPFLITITITMSSYFLTGSSSGLGLAIVTQLASLPKLKVSYIFATARTKSLALSNLCDQHPGRVIFISLDVTDNVSCEKAASKVQQIVGEKGLDVLINNAGVNPRDDAERMDDLEVTLNSNVIGVRNVTRALIGSLRMGKEKKKVVNMYVCPLA
jgi:NAD(P)-dependent dehydrogenase (short-subunit alcohol dehydrogenase family)